MRIRIARERCASDPLRTFEPMCEYACVNALLLCVVTQVCVRRVVV